MVGAEDPQAVVEEGREGGGGGGWVSGLTPPVRGGVQGGQGGGVGGGGAAADAGFTHVDLSLRAPYPDGGARWIADEIVTPLRG